MSFHMGKGIELGPERPPLDCDSNQDERLEAQERLHRQRHPGWEQA